MSSFVLLLLTILVVTLPHAADSACKKVGAIEINSSIRIYSDIDWKFGCHYMLEKARAFGGDRVNFIPTHFWIDEDDNLVPDFYTMRMGRGQFVKPTADLIDEYSKAMSSCFKKAVALGFKWIEVTPHLDDGDASKDRWRNEMILDPFKAYGDLSYVQVLIDPLVAALVDAVPAGVDVYMSIQGEMNAVLINMPKEWTQLITYMRTNLGKGAFATKIGINNNFNKICAACPTETNWAPTPGQFDNAAILAMYNAADFVAISAYAPVDYAYPNLKVKDLESSITIFAKELAYYGVSLQKLLGPGGKGFHYSEFGLGGGIGDGSCPSGCPVRNGLEAAKYPYQGIGGPYTVAKDPWKNADAKSFMQQYFTVATQFAAAGTGGTWKVDTIFMWNSGSYDVQAIYPYSTVRVGTDLGSYRDEKVVALITNHNKAC